MTNRTSSQPELLITLDPRVRQPMHVQIQQAVRGAIRERRIRAGAAVPSTRTLASDLGISRGVVVAAYDQLIAEGYLIARRGAATRVTDAVRAAAMEWVEPEQARFEFDFRPGHPDLRSFPWDAWRRSSRKALEALGPGELGYGDPRGTLALRSVMAEYLARARRVVGSPAHVVICTGCAQGLSIAARVLRSRGMRRIALEDPCHPEVRGIIVEAGLEIVSVPVDEDGLCVDVLERTRAQAVVVSPAHQNPTGSVLAPTRRQQLLAWASRTPGFVIEDDYDAEYRYDRGAVGALQGLAPERVLYVGSASKLLAPGLRLGWMMINGPLLRTAVNIKRHLDNGSPAIQQLAFATFVHNGELDRHLRRMRQLYRPRRDALLRALSQHFPRWTVRGAAAGLHLLAEAPRDVNVTRIVTRASAQSVRLYPLTDYLSRNATLHGLVFGYARLSEHEIEEAIRRIASQPRSA